MLRIKESYYDLVTWFGQSLLILKQTKSKTKQIKKQTKCRNIPNDTNNVSSKYDEYNDYDYIHKNTDNNTKRKQKQK